MDGLVCFRTYEHQYLLRPKHAQLQATWEKAQCTLEQAQYTAAIELELARSISQINSVQSARVHIAASRQSSYIRNREPAKASVVVMPYPGRVITDSQVQSIVNLVSSSIPYLSTEAVSVVDAQGNLLSDNLSPAMRVAN